MDYDLDYDLELRFGDVAYALGMTGNTNPLRNWLRRGQVAIEGGYGGGWARFTYRDLTALAIIQRLVGYNVGVERAAQLVEPALNAVWRPEYEASPNLATPSIDGSVDPKAPPPLPSRLYMFTDREGNERLNWGTADHIVDANSWVVIDVHQTISSTVARALERVMVFPPGFNNKLLDDINTLAAEGPNVRMQEATRAKQAAMQAVQAAMRDAGVAIEFAPDGTVKVLAEKSKAISRKRRKRKTTKS
jgi:hypothetical protein